MLARKLLLTLVASLCFALIMAMDYPSEFCMRSGGTRVFDTTIPASEWCAHNAYAPFILHDPDPVLPGHNEVLYSMGGWIYRPVTDYTDLMADTRFADRVYYSVKDRRGAWGAPELMLDRHNFSWMDDRAYLEAHREAYIGAVTTGSVVKKDGRYFMAFAATVSDSNVCAGEHPIGARPYGSCTEPWSYFMAFWATSTDGRHWTVEENPYGATQTNRALQAAFLGMVPTSADKNVTTGAGMTGLSAISLIESNGWWYFNFTFWSTVGPKTMIGRVAIDTKASTGFTGDPQVWDNFTEQWYAAPRGALPRWANDGGQQRGNMFAFPAGKISRQSVVPGYRYIAPLSGVSWMPRTPSVDRGIYNELGYSLSNDLVHWTPYRKVESMLPGFGDGTAYDSSVLDPFYYEELDGSYSFYFGTASTPDGYHLCDTGAPNHTIPMGPFAGVGVYKGNSKPTARRRAVTIGEKR